MTREALVLLDPDHSYATALGAAARRWWGLATVSVLRDSRALTRRTAQRIGPTVDGRGLGMRDLSRAISREHHAVAVVAHSEAQVIDAARLEAALGIPGADPETAELFRDKAALKRRLREAPGGPRVNASRPVSGPDEVLAARAHHPWTDIVLKPNDGVGNHAIAFISPDTPARLVEEYFAAHPTSPVVMEERLRGREFCVNGQCDAAGRPTTHSVFRTRHTTANGRLQLAEAFELVPTSAPEFALADRYACDVVRAAGLRRRPFHLELIIDDDGACLVEVAARLGGAGMAFDTGHAHGGALSPFAAAVAAAIDRPLPVGHHADWAAYDSRALRTVCGMSEVDARIAHLDGVAEVEALPEFLRWVHRPRTGQRVRPTVDLASIAWQVSMAGGDESHLDQVEQRVRDVLRINPPRPRMRHAADVVRTTALRAARRTTAGVGA